MQWYPLTHREASLILTVFIISGIFNLVQQYFIPPGTRPFAYTLVVFLLLTGFFFAVKPQEPMELGKFLAVLLGGIVTVIIVLRDIIMRQNYSWTLAVVIAGAFLIPLIAAGIYGGVRKLQARM